jgi:hypothetical protein
MEALNMTNQLLALSQALRYLVGVEGRKVKAEAMSIDRM